MPVQVPMRRQRVAEGQQRASQPQALVGLLVLWRLSNNPKRVRHRVDVRGGSVLVVDRRRRNGCGALIHGFDAIYRRQTARMADQRSYRDVRPVTLHQSLS